MISSKNKEKDMTGKVEATLIGSDRSSLATMSQASILLSFEGIVGDGHAGFTRGADSRTPWYPRGTIIRNDRQVSIVSAEELALIAKELHVPEVKPEWLGANLLLSGIPNLSLLSWVTRLVFSSGAVLSQLRENNPCSGPGKLIAAAYNQPDLISQFPKAAMHLRGLVATVELPGIIAQGDEVQIVN
jgi:hypothetical protein